MPSEELYISEGSLGLVSNTSNVDSPRNSFRMLKNFTVDKRGLITSIKGRASAQINSGGTLQDLPALPSSFTPEELFIFRVTQPVETECVLLFGAKSGRDRFYVFPKRSGIGFVFSDWEELTEAEVGAVGTVSSVTSFTITGLANTATTDYYDHWIIWDQTQSAYDYVTGQTGTAFTTRFGITGVTAADVIVIMRFPIFKKAATVTPYYLIDSLPTFETHGEAVTIHTGAHNINSGPDLHLSWITDVTNGSRTFFNDTPLLYGGWHFDFAHPFRPRDTDLLTLGTAGTSTDPFPWTSGNEYYIVDVTALYDGVQESRPRVYLSDAGSPKFVAISAADRHITVQIDINYRTDLVHESDYATGTSVPTVWSRRIQKLRLYIANATQVDSGSSEYQPNSDFFFVKEINIDDSSWSLTSGQFRLTTTITGTEYREAQGFPFSSTNGYTVQQTGANSKYSAQVGNRTIIAPIYDDTLKPWRALFTPVGFAGASFPNVYPVRQRIDVPQYVPDIVGMVEQYGRVIFFGKSTFVVCTVTGESAGLVAESLQKAGCVSYRTIRSADGNVLFASPENILELFDGNNLATPAPGYWIKDIWDDLTPLQKEAAFSGYHRKQKRYVIQVSGRIFVYDLRFGNWFEYVPATTFVSFAETSDGRLLGVTTAGLFDIFADTPSETLVCTLEPQVYNGSQALYRRQRLRYKSNTLILIYPTDDSELSALQLKDPQLFAPASTWAKSDFSIGVDTDRFTYRLQSSSIAAPEIEIETLGAKRILIAEV